MGLFSQFANRPASKEERAVPPWSGYYPDLSRATPAQRKYYEYWLKCTNRGEYPDLGDNLSYFFIYSYALIHDFIKTRNIKRLKQRFNDLASGYPKLSPYLNAWLGDAYLYLNDFDSAWSQYRKNFDVKNFGRMRVMDFLNIKFKGRNRHIDGADLILLLGVYGNSGITNFGRVRISEVTEVADLLLKDFQVERGKNLMQFCLDKIEKHNDLSENDLKELERLIGNEEQFKVHKKLYMQEKKHEAEHPEYNFSTYGHSLFNGVPGEMPTLEFPAMASLVEVAIIEQAKKILREAENTVREEMGIPHVGEGWVSETELYYKIKHAFIREEVVHHGRPLWLKPQHLDIFFPKHNIGIEYQGQQHIKPTDFFGGEQAFKLQLKRDKRKQKKCKENNCRLFYVYEDYEFKKLTTEINKLIGN